MLCPTACILVAACTRSDDRTSAKTCISAGDRHIFKDPDCLTDEKFLTPVTQPKPWLSGSADHPIKYHHVTNESVDQRKSIASSHRLLRQWTWYPFDNDISSFSNPLFLGGAQHNHNPGVNPLDLISPYSIVREPIAPCLLGNLILSSNG